MLFTNDGCVETQVLGNEETRTRYNQFGHAGVDGNMGAGGFQGTDAGHQAITPADLLLDQLAIVSSIEPSSYQCPCA
jgi:DnaJ-class molecular chaperone